MIDLKITFTTKVYDEESPIELSIEEARELYEELGKVFGNCATWGVPSESVNKNGHRFSCMCAECAGKNVVPL